MGTIEIAPAPRRSRVRTWLISPAVGFGLVAAFLAGRASNHRNPPDPSISDEIAQLDREISEAEKEDAQFSGGLVKALVEARHETLKQTRAMLVQKQKSIVFGIGLRFRVGGHDLQIPANAREQVGSIEAELASQREKISRQRVEASLYSGGLVQALSLSTLAMMEQTESMLDQKRLSLKFGLPQYIGLGTGGPGPVPAVAPQPASEATNQTPKITENLFEILSVTARVTESNDVWSKWAWILRLRNKDTVAHVFSATIKFYDSGGFVVDEDSESSLRVEALEESDFAGYKLVTAGPAQTIARTGAEVRILR